MVHKDKSSEITPHEHVKEPVEVSNLHVSKLENIQILQAALERKEISSPDKLPVKTEQTSTYRGLVQQSSYQAIEILVQTYSFLSCK